MQPSDVGPSSQRPEGRSRLRIGLLLVILLLAGAVLIEKAVVTDAERLDLLFVQLCEALAAEDGGAMDRLLEGHFSYSGPRPLGDGDRDEAMKRLREFWDETSGVKLSSRSREVTVQGSVGVISGKGHLRFEWGDSMALYKVSFEIAALKTQDGWVAQGVRLTELTPGLF